MARRGRARGKAPGVDPFLAFALFAAVGVATWTLDQPVRLTLTWLVLLVFALISASGRRLQFSYVIPGLARGAVAGLVISLPLVLIGGDFLLATSQRVFSAGSTLGLLWSVVLIMPAVETLFFRGLVQGEKGLWPSVLLYAGAGVVYFLPASYLGQAPAGPGGARRWDGVAGVRLFLRAGHAWDGGQPGLPGSGSLRAVRGPLFVLGFPGCCRVVAMGRDPALQEQDLCHPVLRDKGRWLLRGPPDARPRLISST